MEEMSLVLVGKCGSGKSSLGNSLLLAKKFKVNMFGGTDVCQIETRNLDNRQQLVVMDTPGFSSLNRSDDDTEQQLDLGLQLLNPGRRIFILVISLRDRQGKADIELLKFLQMKSGIYTMVVFTGVDQLEDEEITLAEYLQTSTQEFRNFFESNWKTRINTINNKDKSEYKTNVDTILKLAEQILTSNMQHLSAAGTSASCSVDNSASNDVKDEHVVKVMLLGKSRIGKSALGNSLLGETKFRLNILENFGTLRCQLESRSLEDGTKLIIADTPGFFPLNRPNQDIIAELQNCLDLLKPGPHVFILVLSINESFTDDETDTIEFLETVFGEAIFTHMIIVFTWLDSLLDAESPFHNKSFEEIIQGCAESILSKCGHRKTGIYNKGSKEELQEATKNILDAVVSLVKINNSSSYTRNMIQETQASINELKRLDTHDEHVIKVMLLGKSGMGKSALGNSLLRKKKFKTNILENLGTKQCQLESRSLDDGTKLIIADTPGFFRMTRSNQEIITELQNCLDLLKPGPHVFILVLSINERFTGDEAATIEFLETVFGKDVFTHIIIVFTWLDILLDADSHLYNKNFQEIIPACTQQILSKCGHRKTGINNKGSKEELQEATKNILDAVVSLVKINNYSSYTRNMIQETQASINELKRLDNHGEQSGFWDYTKSTIKRKFENISKTIKWE